MPSKSSLLKIDAGRAAKQIQSYIQNLVAKYSARGVLIGLSGGIDSAVLTTLAVRALGKDLVHVSYLYDRDSERESRHKARLVANWLGLELEVRNIEPLMRARGIYAPIIMRIVALSRFLNRHLLDKSCRLILSESPFISTLRGGFNGSKFKSWVYNSSVRHIEAGFNSRHIYRREMLEKEAKDHNWLLLGAANRSEYLVGWFVKDGIDDLPLSPLIGLYKTQVQQLAAYLKIPSEIQNQIPSPDMMKGVSDESAIGMSYTKLDIVLDSMGRGLTSEEMMSVGTTEGEISLVREMNRLSFWKRKSEHVDSPVDGSMSGGLRVF
jgi:NAD+ synthase